MRYSQPTAPEGQLVLSGMPRPKRAEANGGPRSVLPGRQVLYLGKVAGGPRYGTKGMVRQSLGRTAVVDMGRRGTWHIPYYFLSVYKGAA